MDDGLRQGDISALDRGAEQGDHTDPDGHQHGGRGAVPPAPLNAGTLIETRRQLDAFGQALGRGDLLQRTAQPDLLGAHLARKRGAVGAICLVREQFVISAQGVGEYLPTKFQAVHWLASSAGCPESCSRSALRARNSRVSTVFVFMSSISPISLQLKPPTVCSSSGSR